MEVDPPSNSIQTPGRIQDCPSGFRHEEDAETDDANGLPAPGALKRSNSAPMINVLVSSASNEISPPCTFQSIDSQRARRFSSSSMNLASSTPVKVADRLNQLKAEESHIADQDIKKERELRSGLQISSSLTEFSLGDHEPMIAETTPRRPRSFSESLHIFTSPTNIVGAPSPTRVGKQCFSPSMQAQIKSNTFTPSPSPSPTRKTFVRSLSPIIRPSPLGKRKLEPDGDNMSYMSPPKKFTAGPTTPDRLIIHHPLAHSVSSSSFDETSPEHQTVSRMAHMHTVPIGSRPHPHMFGFMPLRDTQDMQTTDSETSDVTESTDMSEAGDSSSSVMLLSVSESPSTATYTPIKHTHL